MRVPAAMYLAKKATYGFDMENARYDLVIRTGGYLIGGTQNLR